ncbi:MAG: ABC transporter permease subunit [Bacillota bacterium]|nr:ABC transporter permease subunit [Bacillota bacterium]MDI7250317.1 ABC transporter permease subunit [Bacillota bacterium]
MKPAAAQDTPGVAASWWDRIRQRTSAWSSGGLGVVCAKEIADHTSGIRFLILFLLVGITGLSSMYVGAQTIRDTVAQEESPYVFLRLFTTSGSLPPFIAFVSFLGPLVGLAMGFDAIVGERNRGTLSRLLSQPIYRDDVINGKFLAGTAMLGWMMGSLGLLVAGLGLILTGVPPTGEEVVRVLAYLVVTVIYVAFWLALGILFSVIFRQAASSALAGIAIWLFFAVFARLLAGLIADTFFPVTGDAPVEVALRNARWQLALGRLSPTVLYEEAIITLLNPSIRTLGPILLEQVEGAIAGFLSPGQSLLLVWPHLVSLVALTAGVFGVAYYLFIRQEIRA